MILMDKEREALSAKDICNIERQIDEDGFTRVPRRGNNMEPQAPVVLN